MYLLIWVSSVFNEYQHYQTCLFFAFSCCEGFLGNNCLFVFLCLEWIYFEILVATLVLDVLPTLGNENRLYFSLTSDSAELPVPLARDCATCRICMVIYRDRSPPLSALFRLPD